MNKYLTVFFDLSTNTYFKAKTMYKSKKEKKIKNKLYKYIELDFSSKTKNIYKLKNFKKNNTNKFINKIRSGRVLNPLPLD